jgi:hypothetical protein
MAHPGLAYRLLDQYSKPSKDSQHGRIPMAKPIQKEDDQDSSMKAKGAERASRLFSLVMLGVCAVILLMIIIMDW